MQPKTFIAFLFAIGLAGLFLVGKGITGFVSLGAGVQELCSLDIPCQETEVCCPFYGEESAGVCGSEDMCGAIAQVTKSQYDSRSEQIQALNTGSLAASANGEELDNYATQLISGFFIFVFSL